VLPDAEPEPDPPSVRGLPLSSFDEGGSNDGGGGRSVARARISGSSGGGTVVLLRLSSRKEKCRTVAGARPSCTNDLVFTSGSEFFSSRLGASIVRFGLLR